MVVRTCTRCLARNRNVTRVPRTVTWRRESVVTPCVREVFAYRSEPTRNQAEIDQPDGDGAHPLAVVRVVGHVLAHRHAAGRAASPRSARACRTSPAPAGRGTPGGRGTGAARPCRHRSPGASPRSAARSSTSFQAGGITSCSMRSIFAGSVDPAAATVQVAKAPLRPRAPPSTSARHAARCTRSASSIIRRRWTSGRSSCSRETRPDRSSSRRALRTLAPDVIGLELALPRFDLSLANRRADEERGRPRGCAGDPGARARSEGGDDHAGDTRRRRLAEPDPA